MRYSARYHYSGGSTGPAVFNTLERVFGFVRLYLYSDRCELNPIFVSIEDAVDGKLIYLPIFSHSDNPNEPMQAQEFFPGSKTRLLLEKLEEDLEGASV